MLALLNTTRQRNEDIKQSLFDTLESAKKRSKWLDKEEEDGSTRARTYLKTRHELDNRRWLNHRVDQSRKGDPLPSLFISLTKLSISDDKVPFQAPVVERIKPPPCFPEVMHAKCPSLLEATTVSDRLPNPTKINMYKQRHQLKMKQNFDALSAYNKEFKLDLKPPFTQEELELYDSIMSPRNNIVLFDRYNTSIKRSHLQCMTDRTWVTDEIINQYMNILLDRARDVDNTNKPAIKCYTTSTFFYTKLAEEVCGYKYDNVRRWTQRGFRKCDLFTMDVVLIPRNVNNTHWTLGVVRMKKKRIEYVDSMGGNGMEFMRHILRYLADESEAKRNVQLDISEWTLENRGSSTPQQNNCSDCGVFTCIAANYLSLGQELDFGVKDISYFRKRMVLDVYNGNAVWGEEKK